MPVRYYANSPATTLSASITAVATNLTVASVAGLPVSYPYTLILDRGTASEEAVEVTAASGTTLTVTRGVDSTTAFAHTTGAAVVHGVTARDLREPNTHVNANSGVHGVTGSVVGTTDTQTLTNKTLDLASSSIINGAWTDYTPTWTLLTVGNATQAARYRQVGKTVSVVIGITLGSTTTVDGVFYPSLPVPAQNAPVTAGSVWAYDNSAAAWAVGTFVPNSYVLLTVGNAVVARGTATTPWTWAAGDLLRISLTYEAA